MAKIEIKNDILNWFQASETDPSEMDEASYDKEMKKMEDEWERQEAEDEKKSK